MSLSCFPFAAVNHLDYLGVQVTWISGAWFLSIFINMLPWESGEELCPLIRSLDFNLFSSLQSFSIILSQAKCYISIWWFTLVCSSKDLGCAAFRRKSCYAISDSTSFTGVIWCYFDLPSWNSLWCIFLVLLNNFHCCRSCNMHYKWCSRCHKFITVPGWFNFW